MVVLCSVIDRTSRTEKEIGVYIVHTHRAIVKEDVAEGAVYGHDER